MKYGKQLEQESVPQWSLHNLDYNSLKHEIKVHTTRDQATAMAIPGQQDPALRKFEDGLYLELCRQHDRVDLFITSKADEISRRLDHLTNHIHKWVKRCPEEPSNSEIIKRQRKFARYERDLSRCNDDVQALYRFSNAQVVAFRKIIKKYKKWTGSPNLGARFRENILSNPKSFTHRDFTHLQTRHDEIMNELREATPNFSEIDSTSPGEQSSPELSRPNNPTRVQFEELPPPQMSSQVKYWNEYDDGSETGGPEDEYTIYINPDDDYVFPGFGYLQGILTMPFEKVKQWFNSRRADEEQPLLAGGQPSQIHSSSTTNVDSDEEGYSSSDGYPTYGYSTFYAFPSVGDQKMIRYREKVLTWSTIGCFFASYVLIAIASVLISTGKHKLRVEVDAAVTVGVVISLFCACSALGMSFYRTGPLGILARLLTWCAFIVSCVLNGMLLVLVVGNTP